MKKFTKIVVFATALFAFACTTDTTQDLNIGLKGQTTLTLSLEASRTQLGQAVEGLYPLYWSDGDKISINGIESNEAAINSANRSNASFTISEVVETPYCIAYPAAEQGQVVFAAEQTHADNTTFGKGVATMYGYSESGEGVQLHHLTGVLKIGVTGSAIISKVQISTVNGAIAGAFNIDFTTGEITPSANATNVINYTFGESADGDNGITLTNEPQYLHIAVPAGEYNYLHVTLYDANGGVMSANIQADDNKPLEAGCIRYFKESIAYTPNTTNFIIADYDDLVEFASIAATTDKDALVVENIAVPANAVWTPINGFAKVFNGNGHTISGMKAPLFGTTSATIKNVKLTDVNIDVTDTLFAGAIAVTLESTAEATAQLINCEASGTITLNYNTVTLTTNFDPTLTNIGGLVARAYGANFSKCVNRINLVGALVSPADIGTQKIHYSPTFGGIVGYTKVATSGTATTLISECENYGSITINDSKANETYSSPALGGIAGVISDKSAVIEHCDNHAPIAQNSLSRQTDAAGIVGRSYSLKFDSCTNHEGGTITFTKIGRYSFFGGICGNSYAAEYTNCTNKADITYSPDKNSNTGYQFAGGIIGYTRTTAHTITNCVNEGKISHTANMYNGTSNCYAFIGGVIGYSYISGSITGCVNNGEIYISGIKGNTAITGTGTATHFSTGGLFGYVSRDDVAISDCTNNGIINYDVTIYGSGTLSDQYVGGIAGYTKSKILNSTNNGAVNLNTQVQAVTDKIPAITLCAGGCVGLSAGQINNCVNKGAVTFAEGAKAYGYNIGGLAGYTGATIVSSHNEGAISVYGDAVETDATLSSNKIGGLAGYAGNTMTDSTNKATGAVTVTGKMFPSGKWPDSDAGVSIGGLVGHKNGTNTNCHNYAPLTVALNLEQGSFAMVGGFYVAGLFGYAGNTATDCSNEGKITVNGGYDLYNSRYGHLDIAGCICRRANAAYTNVDNKGDIEVNVNYTSTANKNSSDPNNFLIGGVFAGFGGDDALTNCDNSGNITIGEGTIVEKADVFLCVGGVTATSAASVNHTNCHNSGNITMNGTAKHGAIIGGLIARNVSAATYEKCSNSGNILITTGKEGTSYTKSAYAGGMSGSQSSNVCTCTGFTNSGSIIFRGKTTDTCRLGGIVGSQTQAATAWTGIVNTGDITLEGEYVDSKTFVGGVVGNSSKGISGSQTLCNITAIGASNVGMVLGVARSTSIIASGCKVGGTITTKMTTTEDSDGIEVSIPDTVALTENNFFEYIYSSIIDETAAAEDGCSYISEIAKGE